MTLIVTVPEESAVTLANSDALSHDREHGPLDVLGDGRTCDHPTHKRGRLPARANP